MMDSHPAAQISAAVAAGGCTTYSEPYAPDALYWTRRYLDHSDRWTRVQHVTTLADSLLKTIRESPELREGARFLDVGCGTMWTAVLLKEAFPQSDLLGIDFALDAVFEAYPDLEQQLRRTGLGFAQCDLYDFCPDTPYDAVLDLGVLHHLPPSDWPRYSAKIASFVRPGGALLMRSFDPSDVNWRNEGGTGPGGHVRNGYYCHYHTLGSITGALAPWFAEARKLDRCEHNRGHVESLFHLKRTDRTAK
jgi:SAM-dependent methyltransferase